MHRYQHSPLAGMHSTHRTIFANVDSRKKRFSATLRQKNILCVCGMCAIQQQQRTQPNNLFVFMCRSSTEQSYFRNQIKYFHMRRKRSEPKRMRQRVRRDSLHMRTAAEEMNTEKKYMKFYTKLMHVTANKSNINERFAFGSAICSHSVPTLRAKVYTDTLTHQACDNIFPSN